MIVRALRKTLFAVALFGPALLRPVFADAADVSVYTAPMTSRVAETPYPSPSRSIGGAANGCLAGGVPLPLSGPGWETLRPERNRFWGNPALISFVADIAANTRGLGRLLIGDLSQPRGGHMTSGHGSHQTGVDVDILYGLADHTPTVEERANPDLPSVVADDGGLVPALWGPSQVSLLKMVAADSRVDRIFVNPMIKKALCASAGADREWLRALRPWWGHADHFHVRIRCPEGNSECIAGAALPEGDGCGAELESWITSGDWKGRPKASSAPEQLRRPEMPEVCRTILSAF